MNIKRNNPGNMRKDPRFVWVGEQPTKVGDYLTFDTAENGARAMLKDLNNKVKAGTDTIRKIITKWAPPTDNNATESYISFVSKRAGISSTQQLSINDFDAIGKIATQMTVMEHGLKDIDLPGIEFLMNKGKSLLGIVASTIEKKELTAGGLIAISVLIIWLFNRK